MGCISSITSPGRFSDGCKASTDRSQLPKRTQRSRVLHIALLRNEDLASAIGLLERSRVSVAGWINTAVYRAICTSPHAVTIVARQSGVVGIALVELSR